VQPENLQPEIAGTRVVKKILTYHPSTHGSHTHDGMVLCLPENLYQCQNSIWTKIPGVGGQFARVDGFLPPHTYFTHVTSYGDL